MSETPDHRPTEPPKQPNKSDAMSPEQLAEAKRYGRQSLVCDLADRALDIVYLGVMALVLARPIDRWLQSWPLLDRWWTLRLTAMFAIVFAAHVAVSFLLSAYSGHVLEHRFGLSNQTFGAWLWRYVKRILLAGVFGLAMFVGLFWLIWTTGSYWWLFAAGAFFLVSVLLGQLAPVLIMPLFHKIVPLDYPELQERLGRLVEGTGLSIEGVYRLDLSEETSKANAMLAGLGRTRRVLLGDTLINECGPDELEVIFAHEIGHHVFRHIHKLIFIGLVYSTIGFWVCDRLIAIWVGPIAGGINGYALLPVYVLPLIMLILTVFTNLIEPIQNIISRRFERQCDRYALARTGRREAYLSAFRKLAKLNKDDPDPHWLETFLFHSHPPIGQRLAMAESLDRSTRQSPAHGS
ncbi:MAG: M48 family metallopeptidase [Pirellulales bacterium]|nr:M48 family metallopeptidase [Pirellulales bacterium]